MVTPEEQPIAYALVVSRASETIYNITGRDIVSPSKPSAASEKPSPTVDKSLASSSSVPTATQEEYLVETFRDELKRTPGMTENTKKSLLFRMTRKLRSSHQRRPAGGRYKEADSDEDTDTPLVTREMFIMAIRLDDSHADDFLVTQLVEFCNFLTTTGYHNEQRQYRAFTEDLAVRIGKYVAESYSISAVSRISNMMVEASSGAVYAKGTAETAFAAAQHYVHNELTHNLFISLGRAIREEDTNPASSAILQRFFYASMYSVMRLFAVSLKDGDPDTIRIHREITGRDTEYNNLTLSRCERLVRDMISHHMNWNKATTRRHFTVMRCCGWMLRHDPFLLVAFPNKWDTR